MEPFSALTIATAITQFLDFGCRLVSETVHAFKYRRSFGGPDRVDELCILANDIRTLSCAIKDKSGSLTHSDRGLLPEQVALHRLCRDANSAAADLLAVVEHMKLSGPGPSVTVPSSEQPKGRKSVQNDNPFQTFGVALKRVWKQHKIDEYTIRLSTIKTELVLALVPVVWYDIPVFYMIW